MASLSACLADDNRCFSNNSYKILRRICGNDEDEKHCERWFDELA